MKEENNELSWREDVQEQKNILKLRDGECSQFTFEDEGKVNIHPDYGTSIVFSVRVSGEEEDKVLYVKANNYSLLRQIKDLGALKGMKVELGRKGAKRSDTRYTLTKLS